MGAVSAAAALEGLPIETAGSRPRPTLAMVGMLILVAGSFGLMVWLTADPARRAVVEGLVRSPFGLGVLFLLATLSSATLILPAPGLALTAIAAAAGEPLLVGLIAGLGQAVGELTGYAAGHSGRSFLPDTAATRRVSDGIQRWGSLVIFILALIPNPLFDVAGIAAGVLRMPVLRYLASAAAGKVIKNLIVASGGATVGGLLAGAGTLAGLP